MLIAKKGLKGVVKIKKLNPDKLSVTFLRGSTPMGPLIPRRYTLTHSDETAELFLFVGLDYAYNEINPNRDEVLAEWIYNNGRYEINANVYVDGSPNASFLEAMVRLAIFKRELPLALEGIFYGDKALLKENPYLLNAPIYINFNSQYPLLNTREFWGRVKEYSFF